MSAPLTHVTGSRRGAGWVAGTAACAVLTAISLVGSQAPAFADAGQNASVDPSTYGNNQDVVNAMAKFAPVNASESVMGYPTGLDRDNNGNVKPAALADVKSTYDPGQAVQDAQNAARQYEADTKNPKALRDSAGHLVDGWPGGKKPNNDVRQNTNDDVLSWSGGQKAEQYCGMANKDPKSPSYGQTAPCVFVGKLDENGKYPVKGSSDGVAGEAKLTYKVSASVTNEKSVTEGWSAGGKITPKIGDGKSEIQGEASFSYSYATTSTNRVQNTLETSVEINIPKGQKGYLEGRANGAYYVGYIVLRDIDSGNQEHLVAIPARVYVQSAKTTSPLTWFKRLTPA
ncbi:hypothetical protein ACFOSC_20570 [Streptantibioticus rubrisoli]|uniref:Uncharacterized protein n=1 Tax=Streptantibioticus rubrisoli TaxID=1387313 RepID=A0ABT1PH88_9ACTN|nr:hypothetical protein [Streptantibioticus rubrisoli]MCQ4044719.1 hypothetical protein [Streptantibioticus rubrisoli]